MTTMGAHVWESTCILHTYTPHSVPPKGGYWNHGIKMSSSLWALSEASGYPLPEPCGLGQGPLGSLESGGAVSSNSHPCPRTLQSRGGDERAPSHLLSAFRLATWGAASGRRDRLVSRELCSLHHQPCGRGRQRAQDGAAAGGDGCVAGPTAQRPSHGGHSFSPPTSKWSCLPPRSIRGLSWEALPLGSRLSAEH